MVDFKKWEYVIKSLKKLDAPKRAVDLSESIEEQLEVYGLNLNTEGWEFDGNQMIIGSLFDLRVVLHEGKEYCYCCETYYPHCDFCPFNSPSIKGCSKELMELLDIVMELKYNKENVPFK